MIWVTTWYMRMPNKYKRICWWWRWFCKILARFNNNYTTHLKSDNDDRDEENQMELVKTQWVQIHQSWPFLTTFQSTKVIQDPSRGFRPNFKKSQILPFLECGNWLFNRTSDCLEFSEIFKLEWIISRYDLAPIKPKTTSLYLSRNNWSNSAPRQLPPKCFQPKTSKSPCICLGNEKWPKKSVCKWPKNVAGTLKTSKLTISDNFSINKGHPGPFQRLPNKFQKISDFAIFRVRKLNFQSRLWFFKNYWDFKTQMGHLRKWVEPI